MQRSILHTGLAGLIVGLFVWCTMPTAVAQQPSPDKRKPRPTVTDRTPESSEVAPNRSVIDEDMGYYDEPPLDLYQRQWRWYTRQAKPQHFARRDSRRRYGYNPPFNRRGGYSPYGGFGSYGYDGSFGNFDNGADGYIQGRHDERRFRDWEERNNKGKKAYTRAMLEGVRLFRETDYVNALHQFILAAKLNQGDPASRLHATYALVAIGNYDDAVLMVRRAIQLQPKILHLPLRIRGEYGPQVDFDAHVQRLSQATHEAEGDPGLWMLLGFYRHFSGDAGDAGDAGAAWAALRQAKEIAPRDPIIGDFYESVRLTTPSSAKR